MLNKFSFLNTTSTLFSKDILRYQYISIVTLGFLHSRTNLSPFTKDFRGEGHCYECITYFS